MRSDDVALALRPSGASEVFAWWWTRACGQGFGPSSVLERHSHLARRQELPYQPPAVFRRERVANPLGNRCSSRVRKVRFETLHEHECRAAARFNHAPKCPLIAQFSPHDVFLVRRMRESALRTGRHAVRQSIDEPPHVDHR